MANDFYENSDSAQRFQPGTTVRADEVDAKFDQVAAGFDDVNIETDRALKFPVEAGVSQEFTATILQRRRKMLGFDAVGNLALTGVFNYRGDWTPTTEYFLNDMLRDSASKNLYVVTQNHTSGATFSAANMDLVINVEDVEAAKQAAELAESNAGDSADAAAIAKTGSETAQGLSEDARDASQTAQGLSETARDASQTAQGLSEAARNKSQDWAEEAEDVPVETGQFSAKHWAAKASGIVANGVIDDAATNTLLTWSSQKITGQLSAKVDKVTGKALSDNNFTTAYKTELDNLQTELNTKVDKVTGKALSDENLTTANKAKLDNLQPASRGLQLFMGG